MNEERIADAAVQLCRRMAETDGQLHVAIIFDLGDPVASIYIGVAAAQQGRDLAPLEGGGEHRSLRDAGGCQTLSAQIGVDVSVLLADTDDDGGQGRILRSLAKDLTACGQQGQQGEWDQSFRAHIQSGLIRWIGGLERVGAYANMGPASLPVIMVALHPDQPIVLVQTPGGRSNYPNPFNAQTSIPFHLPGATRVVLKVFDVMGQTVATLVDDRFPAGSHTLHWNGL
ncbi:uncharacterized protein METZ01_LOCUS407402, partial [marine metagenome]